MNPSNDTDPSPRPRKRGRRSGRKHKIIAEPDSSLIYHNLVLAEKKIVPTCVVRPTIRPVNPITVIAPADPIRPIAIIDLELELALQQRRRALLEENHPNRVIEREEAPLAAEFVNGDISDDDTVIMEPEVEILD